MSEARDRSLLEYEADKAARQRRIRERQLRVAPRAETDLFELTGWLAEGAVKAKALAVDVNDTEVSRQVRVLHDQAVRLGQLLAVRRRTYGNSTAGARAHSDSASASARKGGA